ncbi:MAG: hypothetical protein IJM53_05905 [Lachnospiraceae bacterium]|nr:hypothetical protein [Lachnospiraceae bacterium]
MMKFFQKSDKTTFLIKFVAFLWILLCNVIVLLLHEPLLSIGVPSWTIFLANVLFFIKDNKNQKEGLLENALGGIFGLVCAYGLVAFKMLTMPKGMSDFVSTFIPVAIFLFLTIALSSYVPYVFNNIALCFFLVALITSSVYGQLPGHILGVIIGNVIVNLGLVLIIGAMIKSATKKAMAKAAAAKKTEE